MTRSPAKPVAAGVYLAEMAAGLEDVAAAEISRCPGARLLTAAGGPSGEILFTLAGPAAPLLRLNTLIAVYSVHDFAVPRPKALLGHEHLQRLRRGIEHSQALHPAGAFRSLYISAAGDDSSVLLRLKQELAAAAGLAVATDEGDLLLRLRRIPNRGHGHGHGQAGWQALIRLSPRPLATRPWRVRDMPGALNASVAHAMIALSQPQPTDTCLNIGCGSGTILIERWRHTPARRMVGCDLAPAALALAAANLVAAGLREHISLWQADMRGLPLPAGSIHQLYADLPFGSLVGSHAENRQLYPALLTEAARVAAPAGRLTLITHEIRLLDSLLPHHPAWVLQERRMVTLGGLHPRLYLLVRR